MRSAIEGVVRKEITESLLTVLTLDRLTENSKLSEEDVMRLSKVIKRVVRERWDAEGSNGTT